MISAIAHIGCLFSDIVVRRPLSLDASSPIRSFQRPSFTRDTANRRSRKARQRSFA
jgi:hypothetical protein